jgi:photosystem I P700 chlorophyll a apoprotein A2
MYRTNFGIGHSLQEILDAHTPQPVVLGAGLGLFDTLNNSLHFQLGLALASVGTITSLVAQHIPFLPTPSWHKILRHRLLYTHHQCIAGFILCGPLRMEPSSLSRLRSRAE